MKTPQWTSGSCITLSLTVFTSWFLLESLFLSTVVAFIPRLIISATLLLLIVQLLLDLFGKSALAKREPGKSLPASDPVLLEQAPHPMRFYLSIFWIAALACSTYLLGLVIGPSLFCLLFLRWSAKETWFTSITYSLILALIIYSVFATMLNIVLYDGVLAGALN